MKNKTFFRIVRWQCFNHGGGLNQFPEMLGTFRNFELFYGWLNIGHHFKGVSFWSIEFTIAGYLWHNFMPLFGLGRTKSWRYDLTVRLGGPIITIRRPNERRWSGVKIVSPKLSECKRAFAVPGTDSLIDVINPDTGLSWINGESLREVRQRYPGAHVVNIEKFLADKAARQNAPITWTETTHEKYWEMLECLPPASMMRGGFLVGEPMDHHAGTGQPRFDAFRQIGNKYLAANRPLQISEFKAQMETLNPAIV